MTNTTPTTLKKPLALSLTCGLMAAYSLLDGLLVLTDSREDPWIVFSIAMIAAIVWCWRGSHFGYIFTLFISVGFFISPTAAQLNAPDRLLIPIDYAMGVISLLGLLNKKVRAYFKQQRQNWYQQQQEKAGVIPDWQPLNSASTNLWTQRLSSTAFWQDKNKQRFLVLPNAKNYQAGLNVFLLKDEASFTLAKQLTTRMDKNVLRAIAVISTLTLCVALFVFVVPAVDLYKVLDLAPDITTPYIVAEILVVAAIVFASMLISANKKICADIEKTFAKTNLKLSHKQLEILIETTQPKSKEAFAKYVTIAAVFFVCFVAAVTFFVSPQLRQAEIQATQNATPLPTEAISDANNSPIRRLAPAQNNPPAP